VPGLYFEEFSVGQTFAHEVRRTDHRAPAATPKKMATRTSIAAAPSNAMASLRFTGSPSLDWVVASPPGSLTRGPPSKDAQTGTLTRQGFGEGQGQEGLRAQESR